MRHQNTAVLPCSTYLNEIIESKALDTRALLKIAQPLIAIRWNSYDQALTQLKIPALMTWGKSTEKALLSCYQVKTQRLTQLKDEIIKELTIQAPINIQRCPYCMLTEPCSWDHYLPKDYFPEFSVYHPNLIYICLSCNHRKWNYYDTDKLLYCHPYFSVPKTGSLLHCSISVTKNNLTLKYYGADVDPLKEEAQILQRHLTKLRLTTRYQAESASLVSSLISELRQCFPTGVLPDALMRVLERRFALARAELGENAWDARLWHGLSTCPDFLKYANDKITTENAPSSDGFYVPSPPPP